MRGVPMKSLALNCTNIKMVKVKIVFREVEAVEPKYKITPRPPTKVPL
jgi:hypothetical protein